ncbi:hypothetical protein WOLCODRAFT_18674 [Wolfiporia cocos MD-104 SS10]|uniref:Uncharacterized protein n=1 Tax=Wolfiporia cocos (strain MD-104) TaxID=742152 RepID=A0A2H3JP53_WOLCO|nr:hypothetical protein WOLCODRAFT_18674 [Wolfiporia cocos MD-104 SS10]
MRWVTPNQANSASRDQDLEEANTRFCPCGTPSTEGDEIQVTRTRLAASWACAVGDGEERNADGEESCRPSSPSQAHMHHLPFEARSAGLQDTAGLLCFPRYGENIPLPRKNTLSIANIKASAGCVDVDWLLISIDVMMVYKTTASVPFDGACAIIPVIPVPHERKLLAHRLQPPSDPSTTSTRPPPAPGQHNKGTIIVDQATHTLVLVAEHIPRPGGPAQALAGIPTRWRFPVRGAGSVG